MDKLYFATANMNKFDEAMRILSADEIQIEYLGLNISEIQSSDLEAIVKNKVLQAYDQIHRLVFVEHTGLFIEAFGWLPGGLTQTFWDALTPEQFCTFFGQGDKTTAIAKTLIGYCDGRSIRTFLGEISGHISSSPRGNRAFNWDCIFIPDGFQETFAEMDERKHEVSMRKKALQIFARYLKEANAT